jgi:hypothetical protein
MTTLSELWATFNRAYDAYPGEPLHPARVAAREALWTAQHVGWVDEEYDCDCGF